MTSFTEPENGEVITVKKVDQLTNGHTNGHENGINGNQQIEFNEEDFEIIEDVEDPYCIAENPVKVSFQDITSAAFLIKNGIQNTPCQVSVKTLRPEVHQAQENFSFNSRNLTCPR